MLYYKVRKEMGDAIAYSIKNNVTRDVGYLVPNELYTDTEVSRKFRDKSVFFMPINGQCVSGENKIDRMFEVVIVSSRNIYWSFGCRFECGTGIRN